MGREINQYHFHQRDFKAFEEHLGRETALLAAWFQDDGFSARHRVGGLELEAWLVDRDLAPAPRNEEFLELVNDDLVVPELARFNVEINTPCFPLEGRALSAMRTELDRTVDAARAAARKLDLELVFIGILPTVEDAQLSLANMSARQRYRALNEQVLRMRQGAPLSLDIKGREHLRTVHQDVMLEAGATSLQIHLQVEQASAARALNASQIISGPMTAVCANSPYLFGRDLWEETRIPLFEQAVAVREELNGSSLNRVTFGSGYADESLFEFFQENHEAYGVLLPIVFESPPEAMAHLRLHNGTIWRWNRPLIGFDTEGVEQPHLRIEHRVAAAGPTNADTMANTALFFGLTAALMKLDQPPEASLDFAVARENFYECARNGLSARVQWLDGSKQELYSLLLSTLIPMAREGLPSLGLDEGDCRHYLDIIEARVRSRTTGTGWQRRYTTKYGRDMRALTAAYLERQLEGRPVHEWTIQ